VRRAVLTMLWLSAGVVGVLFGRSRSAPEVRDAGFLLIAAATVKLVTFDTTHLQGGLRIGLLVVASTVLFAASAIAKRINKRA
jgi:hypothetical protein